MSSTEIIAKNENSNIHQFNIVDVSNKIFIAFQKSPEFSETVKFLNNIDKIKSQNLCYISIISSYIHIENVLFSIPPISKNIYIVDCVSKLLVDNLKDNFNVIFRNSPNSFDKIKKVFLDAISFFSPQVVILDSLSQFLNYSNLDSDELIKLFLFFRETISDKKNSNIEKIILLFNEKLSSDKKNNDLKNICKNMNIDCFYIEN